MSAKTVFLLSAFCFAATSANCPADWHEWEDPRDGRVNCYRLIQQEKSFCEAEALCNQIVLPRASEGTRYGDGHLASVHSEQEDEFLHDLIRDELTITSGWGPQVFIGMYVERGEQAREFWTDGSSSSYSGWFPGEPNDSVKDGSLGAIAAGEYAGGKWADVLEGRYKFICKVPVYKAIC